MSNIDKHIAYWVTLKQWERDEFRRHWPWLADLYDTVVQAKVGNDPGVRSGYRGLARALQVEDHLSATRGQTLPEVPSLSAPNKKGEPYSRKRTVRQINRLLRNGQ